MGGRTSVRANDPSRETLSEGALAPLLGALQKRRATGWLRISGMQLRGGIPSVVRLGLRLQDGRVIGVEAGDDPLRPLPPTADLAERATHGIARVLACRDAVQSWEPAEKAESDPAAPWLTALALRALERLDDATVRSAMGDVDRGLVAARADEAASAALTQAQRALATCVRGDVKGADLLRSVGPSATRDLLALLCAGAVDWAAAAPVAEAEPRPTPASAARAPEGPRTATSLAANRAAASAAAPPSATTTAPPAPAASAPAPARGPRTATSNAALSSAGKAAARPPAPAPAPPSLDTQREEIERAHAALRGATHFQVLGLTVGATVEEVRQAFARLARRYHPDAQRDPGLHDLRPKLTALFVAVSDSYGILKDPAQRERYERSMGLQAPRAAAPAPVAPLGTPSASPVGDPVEARLLAAEEALGAQQPWEAIRLLEEAIPASQGGVKVRAQILLGRSYAARERPREAEKILLDALQSDPRSVPACLLLGRLYRDRGMAKRARGMFERVLDADPRNAEARRELGVPSETPLESPPRGSLLSRLRDRH
jgi:tetratricopeptide (TPR) repeat protein